MFVPMLLVLLQVIRDKNGNRLSPPAATKYGCTSFCSTHVNHVSPLRQVFSGMFSPTIMLLIGGFTISSALSKTNIDRVLITKVLSLAGTRPSTVLLAFMCVSCFASMWIRSVLPVVRLHNARLMSFSKSNVAAPTLCFTLIRVRVSSFFLPFLKRP